MCPLFTAKPSRVKAITLFKRSQRIYWRTSKNQVHSLSSFLFCLNLMMLHNIDKRLPYPSEPTIFSLQFSLTFKIHLFIFIIVFDEFFITVYVFILAILFFVRLYKFALELSIFKINFFFFVSIAVNCADSYYSRDCEAGNYCTYESKYIIFFTK